MTLVYLHRSAQSDIIRGLHAQPADDTVSVGRCPVVSPQRRSRPSAGLRVVRESHGRAAAHDGRSTQRDHGSGPVAGPMPYQDRAGAWGSGTQPDRKEQGGTREHETAGEA